MKSKAKKLKWIRQQQTQKPALKRYPKPMLISQYKLMTHDPETMDRFMSLDEGAYIISKP